jgi:hypothetical protein
MIEFEDYSQLSDQQFRELFLVGKTPEQKVTIQNGFVNLLHHYLEQISLSDTLFVTDPFLLNAWRDTWGSYLPLLDKVFKPLYSKVKKIVLIVERHDPDLVTYFKRHVNTHGQGCEVRIFQCNLYHDRIWLSSGSRQAVYVGTSLTGIGSKYTFVNPLPEQDVKALFPILQRLLTSTRFTELGV